MLYEGQIFHNLSVRDDVLLGLDYWLDVPIRIGLRQLTESSFPVWTPSFNPGLRLYLASHDEGTLEDKQPKWYYSFGLHHYSNGQDGRSIGADGLANTRGVESGSWSRVE